MMQLTFRQLFALNVCESVWKGLVGLELKGQVRANMHRPWPPCSSAVDLRTHTGDRDSGVCEDFGRQRHTEEGGQMYTQVTFQLHKKEVCCDEKQNSNTQLEIDVRQKDIAYLIFVISFAQTFVAIEIFYTHNSNLRQASINRSKTV